MEQSEKWGMELAAIWMGRARENRESFGYLISGFLNKHPVIDSAKEVKEALVAAKKIAEKIIQEHPEDQWLLQSYVGFRSALDHFIHALN